MHQPMHWPMHGSACSSTPTPIRPHLRNTEQDYMILLLNILILLPKFLSKIKSVFLECEYKVLLYAATWVANLLTLSLTSNDEDVVEDSKTLKAKMWLEYTLSKWNCIQTSLYSHHSTEEELKSAAEECKIIKSIPCCFSMCSMF